MPNLLATKTIFEHGDRDRAPGRGGPPTGTSVVVEKKDGVWRAGDDLADGTSVSAAPGAATDFEARK